MKKIIDDKLASFFSNFGTLAITIGIILLIVGYFFVRDYLDYIYLVATELYIIGVLCYLSALIDDIWKFIKRLIFGGGKRWHYAQFAKKS